MAKASRQSTPVFESGPNVELEQLAPLLELNLAATSSAEGMLRCGLDSGDCKGSAFAPAFALNISCMRRSWSADMRVL